MKFLLCYLFNLHDLEPIESLSPTTTKMFCHRCEKQFGFRVIGDEDLIFPWTSGMEVSLRIRKQRARAAMFYEEAR